MQKLIFWLHIILILILLPGNTAAENSRGLSLEFSAGSVLPLSEQEEYSVPGAYLGADLYISTQVDYLNICFSPAIGYIKGAHLFEYSYSETGEEIITNNNDIIRREYKTIWYTNKYYTASDFIGLYKGGVSFKRRIFKNSLRLRLNICAGAYTIYAVTKEGYAKFYANPLFSFTPSFTLFPDKRYYFTLSSSYMRFLVSYGGGNRKKYNDLQFLRVSAGIGFRL